MPGDRLGDAIFGGGCFWCIEAAFKELAGVTEVTSGYAGGHTENPTYKEVCSEKTGHAEVVRVRFDPDVITFRDLLEVFFAIHDPTTRNRQGPDIGSQYRSIILYQTDEQKKEVEDYVSFLEDADKYDDGIVTEISSLTEFYEAEEYHQDYYEKNPDQPYCLVQIPPKLEKLESEFHDKLSISKPR